MFKTRNKLYAIPLQPVTQMTKIEELLADLRDRMREPSSHAIKNLPGEFTTNKLGEKKQKLIIECSRQRSTQNQYPHH
jgi:hypothetical protein